MDEIINKIKKLKNNVLDVLEKKLDDNITINELSILVDCIDKIADDKNLYNLKLVEVLENLHKSNAGYSGISLPSE